MKQCEWCEEYRYKILRQVMNKDKGLYSIEFDNYDDNVYSMDIMYKVTGHCFWETQFSININYCPFCGRDLKKENKYEKTKEN